MYILESVTPWLYGRHCLDVSGRSYICKGIAEDIFPEGTILSIVGSSVCTCPHSLLIAAVCKFPTTKSQSLSNLVLCCYFFFTEFGMILT